MSAGRRALDEGDFEAAAREFRRATDERPDDPRGFRLLARAESLAERPERARQALERLVLLVPDDADAWLEIGITFELEHAYDRALEAYVRAIAAAPGEARPLVWTAVRLLRWGQPAEALPLLERAVVLAPRDEQAWHALGQARYHAGDRPGAVEAFRAGLERRPGSRSLLLSLAATLVNLRRLDEALAAYDEVVSRWPGFAAAHVGRALLLHELGRRDEAEAALVRAVEVASEPAPYRERLAAYRTGRREGFRPASEGATSEAP